MLKFRGSQELEVYISDVGCLVLKQESIELGKEVTIIVSPEQAYHINLLLKDKLLSMYDDWDDGLCKEFIND
jgi:hypothetical protein